MNEHLYGHVYSAMSTKKCASIAPLFIMSRSQLGIAIFLAVVLAAGGVLGLGNRRQGPFRVSWPSRLAASNMCERDNATRGTKP